jgi:hypothetical protein
MPDRMFFPLAMAAAVLMLALAAVFPQGNGVRSPGPFGHAIAPKLRPATQAPKPKTPEIL